MLVPFYSNLILLYNRFDFKFATNSNQILLISRRELKRLLDMSNNNLPQMSNVFGVNVSKLSLVDGAGTT